MGMFDRESGNSFDYLYNMQRNMKYQEPQETENSNTKDKYSTGEEHKDIFRYALYITIIVLSFVAAYYVLKNPWIIWLIVFVIVGFMLFRNNPSPKGNSGGSYNSASSYPSFGYIPSSATGKVYSKNGKGFFDGTYDSNYLIADYSQTIGYDHKTGKVICTYKGNRVYRGETPSPDQLIGFVDAGKIYDKHGAGFFEGSYNSSSIIGYISNGRIYDKHGAGFFEGSYHDENIVGYYEGNEIGAAAVAIIMLLP